MRTSPVVLGLALAITAAFALTGQYDPDAHLALFDRFGVVPAQLNPLSPYAYANPIDALTPLFGHVFFHYGVLHLLMNGLAYMQAAPFVALRVGDVRFLVVFFASALGGALAYTLINPHSESPAVGASGAICGLFGAYFLAVRPSPRMALRDPQVRNAMLSFLFINVVLMALLPLPIAWEAHLGGFVTGALSYVLVAPRHVARGPWG